MPQKFDIFSGSSDKNALWLEAVEGFNAAKARLDELAQETPGYYFLFCAQTHRVVASSDAPNGLLNDESGAPH